MVCKNTESENQKLYNERYKVCLAISAGVAAEKFSLLLRSSVLEPR